MRIGTKRDDGVAVVGGRIEEVDEFAYLGSIVSKKGGTDEDIQARVGKAGQAFAMLRPIRRSTALTTKTKLRVIGWNVKAVLFYGSETWRLTKVSCGFGGLEKSATGSFGDKQGSHR